MFLVKTFSATISMVVLLSSLTISAVLGNGFVLGILKRFKKLRTFPNILIGNLALVDILNALINMPAYLLYAVLEVSWFKGNILAVLTIFFNRLFILLNLVSMSVLLVNVFLAITFDLRYFTWKTNEKAIAIVVVEWLLCLAVVSLSCLPLFNIDLQDAHVFIYRQVVYNNNKTYVAASTALFVACAIVFGSLILRSVRRKKLQRKKLNLPQLQAEARLRMDIQAAKNVAITILAFLVCYIPPILHAVWGRSRSDVNWCRRFLVQFSIFMSSGINPVIYCFRNKRFRFALKQLLKDPCGKRPLQDTKPEQRAQRGIARQDTRQVTASSKITDHPKETSLSPTSRLPLDQRACYSMDVQEERGLSKQDCESNRLRRRNKVMAISLQEQEPGRVVKLAWVEHHHTEGTSFGEESPTTRAEYTGQEVTVKENHHTDSEWTSSGEKSLTTRADCTGQEITVEENHLTDSAGTRSGEESPTTRADYTGQEATVEENHLTDSEGTSSGEESLTTCTFRLHNTRGHCGGTPRSQR